MQNSETKTENKVTPKKPNNGEGVKTAFENAIKSLPNKLNKIWETEKGKKFLTHLMFAFLPTNKKEIFPIGNFNEHNKYKELPKICTLTGFAVSDVFFTMDEATKKHFEEKKMKVNKLVFAINSYGSTESTKILSADSLTAFANWVQSKVADEVGSGEISKIVSSIRKKQEGITQNKEQQKPKKKKAADQPFAGKSTYSLSDKFDFDKLKREVKEKGGNNGKEK